MDRCIKASDSVQLLIAFAFHCIGGMGLAVHLSWGCPAVDVLQPQGSEWRGHISLSTLHGMCHLHFGCRFW
jgi:hypothetical protein